MTTIINTPQPKEDSGGGMGMVIGLVVIVLLGFLFFVYGLPAIRQIKLGGTEINVPDKIDVTVNQPE